MEIRSIPPNCFAQRRDQHVHDQSRILGTLLESFGVDASLSHRHPHGLTTHRCITRVGQPTNQASRPPENRQGFIQLHFGESRWVVALDWSAIARCPVNARRVSVVLFVLR